MTSDILDRFSFLSLLLTIALLPVFFLPFTNIPVEIGKSLILTIGLLLSVIFWTVARFYDGKIRLPKSLLLSASAGVVVIFLLSAIFGDAPNVSMFGVMLDMGTFWFIFAGFLLMFLSSILF